MKTFAFDFYAKHDVRILAFASRKEAINHGNGWALASNEEDLTDVNVTMGQMTELYNALNSESPIKGFRDRPTAIKRMIALAQAKAQPMESSAPQSAQQESESVEKAAKAPKEKKVAKEGGRKGRASSFEGRKIKISSEVKDNPRREGSHGYRSMQILLDNRRGISYEDFLAAGGRRQDLAWDIAHGHAYVE